MYLLILAVTIHWAVPVVIALLPQFVLTQFLQFPPKEGHVQ